MLRFLGFLFAIGFVAFLGMAFAVGYVVWETSKTLPEYTQLAQYEPAVMSRVHASDGQLLAEYANERRLFVPIEAIPDNVVHAFLSAEDKNFFNHNGIDWRSVMRAVYSNVVNLLQGRRHLVGASTITQQVAKNFLLTSERTFDRKLKEALLAQRIEQAFSKPKILELYLNEIYLGLRSYGVAAASLNYFGKSLHELQLHEVAYLAALPKAPNNYDPVRHRERAIERRNWVIDRMLENGYVTEEQARAAQAQSLGVEPREFGTSVIDQAEAFAEEVRRRVLALYDEETLYEGGLSIRTTLDPQMQLWARHALTQGLQRFDRERGGWRGPVTTVSVDGDWGAQLLEREVPSDFTVWRLSVVLEVGDEQAVIGMRPASAGAAVETGQIPFELMSWARAAQEGGGLGPEVSSPSDVVAVGDVVYVAPSQQAGLWHLVQIPEIEGALVALDPHTGRVHALVGGFSYGRSEFNRAVQALRQPGSAFKPFVYAAALESGYTPASVILDEEIEIELQNGDIWRPQNYGGRFYGPQTLRLGIEKSRNAMTVRLAQDMGMERVVEYAERFGIYDSPPALFSMALGAEETSLLRLTAAFGMLVNGGRRIEPTVLDRIQDRFGVTVWRHDARTCDGCSADNWQGQQEPELEDVRPQIIDTRTAYQVVSMLEGVVLRGTGSAVRAVGKPIGGKTGTTNDERDAWFVGFSPDLAVGVYVGYDNPRPMGHGATGGSVAAPVFRDFMQLALANESAIPFRIPPGIQFIPINPETGMRSQFGDEEYILEAFKPGEGPNDQLIIIGADGTIIELPSANLGGGSDAGEGLTTGTGGLY
jgi:penicillin-binding protein 1A